MAGKQGEGGRDRGKQRKNEKVLDRYRKRKGRRYIHVGSGSRRKRGKLGEFRRKGGRCWRIQKERVGERVNKVILEGEKAEEQ